MLPVWKVWAITFDFWDKISELDNVYLLNNNCKSFKDVYFYGFTQSFNYYYEYMNENKDLMKKDP